MRSALNTALRNEASPKRAVDCLSIGKDAAFAPGWSGDDPKLPTMDEVLADRAADGTKTVNVPVGAPGLVGALRRNAEQNYRHPGLQPDALGEALRKAGVLRNERAQREAPDAVHYSRPLNGRIIAAGDADTTTADARRIRDVFFAFSRGPFKLERPSASLMHKAIGALGNNHGWVRSTGAGKFDPNAVEQRDLPTHSLLVEHDWAALLGSNASTVGEWRAPYDAQCFEFQFVGGWRAFAFVGNGDATMSMTVAIRMPRNLAPGEGVVWITDGATFELLPDRPHLVWQPPESKPVPQIDPLVAFLFAQVRATSIMLDAEVAATEAIRAPYNTNQPPKELAALPALSHHVVRLSRKPRRYAPVPGEREKGRERRLHFRRGHWRHFATWKTWINWMLVGNPDLGFVDKDYRL